MPFVKGNFGRVVSAMMNSATNKKWMPRRTTSSIEKLSPMSSACVVVLNRLNQKRVSSVWRSLQLIFVTFATYTMTWVRRKASTTAKNVAFAELEAKIIFITAKIAAAAWINQWKATISVKTNEQITTAQFALAACTVQERRLFLCVAAIPCTLTASMDS